MPFPPDKDSNVFSGRSLRVKKKPQVLSSTGLQYFEELSRKNGTTENRRGDDIMGTMTRLKFQNTETHNQLTGSYLPKLDTEMSIFNSKPQSNNLKFDELLSSTAIESSPPSTDTSGDTGGWADSVSTHDISLNNLISLCESSPKLSDEGREPNLSWTINGPKKYPLANPPSVSPTVNGTGLFKCQFDISQNPEIHQSQFDAHQSPTYSRNRNTSNAHLPHQIQPHFFGVPKADFMQASQASGVNLSEIGLETGLDIYEISKGGLSRVCNLEGLRGGVFNAKIIPWFANYRNSGPFPLIALVVHGPAKKTHEAPDMAVVSEDIMVNYTGVMQDTSWRATDIEYYQTTVELYSLSGSKKHVGTLLSLPRIPLIKTDKNPRVRVPLPVGSLAILADCGNLVITSGISGETWIFKQLNSDEVSSRQFRCVGKVWTTVQHVTKTEEVSERKNDWQKMESISGRKQSNTSIISLNGHWLALCPPTPSTQTSLRGIVTEMNSAMKIPGLTTNTTPQLPEINCSIDTPGVESLMKQIAQVGTQNFIKAGNYIAQQGFQAWSNYRNKPASTTQKIQINQSVSSVSSSFSTKDPGLISVIDLDLFTQSDISLTSSSLQHSTFRVPYGCSFLSFSPNGLSLFTASSKGDIQFVWDLMQIRYPNCSFQISEQIATGTQGPRVRQIARFYRMTVARIVDVVWAVPNGERAAMVTEPGTIHVLDLPTSAFKWPPPSSKTLKTEDHTDQSNSSTVRATSVATSAVNTLWTAARPLVSSRRRSNTCLSARSVSMTASQSTQTLAAGISRSVGAATEKMNEIRKSVGIKLHLPRSSVAPNRACVVFQNKKHNDVIFGLAGSIVRIYTVRNQKADRPSDKQKTPVKIFTECKIPRFSSFKSLSDLDQELRLDEQSEFIEKEIDEIGQKSRQVSLSHRLTPSIESSIPHAEIESNAPYRPFHTDKCVSLYTYNNLPLLSLNNSSDDEIEGSPVISQNKISTWVFGRPIMTTEIDVGKQSYSENKTEHLETSHELSSTASQSVMRISDNADNSEHIIFATRIQKSSPSSNIKGTTYED
ncbi:hypothetical protein EPUL_004790, partial [Erysiphe pulchra]